MTRVLVVHGPGADPTRRGVVTPAPGSPAALDEACRRWGRALAVEVATVWAGDVNAMLTELQRGGRSADALIVVAGNAAFESVALADAVAATGLPAVDLHLRNLGRAGRTPADSRLGAGEARVVHGRGVDGYRWALAHLGAWIEHPPAVVPYGDRPGQEGELRVPDAEQPPHPVAVLVHGGFWRAPWERDVMDGLAVALAARGWATWNVEYRRLGAGGGWPAMLGDVRAAVEHIAALADEWWLDAGDVVVVGHSVGAQLGLLAAARADAQVRPRLVVSLAGVLDLAAAHADGLGADAVTGLLGDPPEARALAAASPVAAVPLGVPALLAHLAGDPLVPLAQSRAYAEAARAAGDDVVLLELHGDDHFALVDRRSAAWAQVAERLPARGTSAGPGVSRR